MELGLFATLTIQGQTGLSSLYYMVVALVTCCTTVIFRRLALRWKDISRKWDKFEKPFLEYPYATLKVGRFSTKLKVTVIGAFFVVSVIGKFQFKMAILGRA